jgi:hypothetical protein
MDDGLATTALPLAEYISALRTELAARSDDVSVKMRHVLDAMPAAAREVGVDVFPDPDGEGTFDVWLRLDGLDVWVLNKAVDPWRHLFGVTWTETSTDPELPCLQRTPDVDVRDVVVDVAADWVESLWREVTEGRTTLPCRIDGEHGYGTSTPRLI